MKKEDGSPFGIQKGYNLTDPCERMKEKEEEKGQVGINKR